MDIKITKVITPKMGTTLEIAAMSASQMGTCTVCSDTMECVLPCCKQASVCLLCQADPNLMRCPRAGSSGSNIMQDILGDHDVSSSADISSDSGTCTTGLITPWPNVADATSTLVGISVDSTGAPAIPATSVDVPPPAASVPESPPSKAHKRSVHPIVEPTPTHNRHGRITVVPSAWGMCPGSVMGGSLSFLAHGVCVKDQSTCGT